jgi:hypothetical protein
MGGARDDIIGVKWRGYKRGYSY